MKLELQSANYTVELTVKQFIALVDLDERSLDVFFRQLEGLGAVNIDYNGHFDPYIFFTCEPDKVGTIFEKIKDIIRYY